MSSLGNLALQGVSLTPKFIFGVNGEIANSLFVIEEKKLLYVAGHFVIVYNMDERTQFFIHGQERSEGINFITVSPCKRFLAICEKGESRAMCTIYEFPVRKRRKTLPENEYNTEDYKSKVFLSAAFSPKNAKQHLLTLAGEPDFAVLLWQWDVAKCLFKISIGFVDLVANAALDKCYYQSSLSTLSQDMFGVITGPNKYLFMQVADNFTSVEVSLSDMDTRSAKVAGISSNYTCHAWTLDTGRLVVGTDMGDILLMDYEGQFL
jgi:hypothetical protein